MKFKNLFIQRGLLRLLGGALALVLLLGGCGPRGNARVAVLKPGGAAPEIDASGSGPHTAVSTAKGTRQIAVSGWLRLSLDEASKTVSVKGYDEADWFTLPQSTGTPRANAGACAVEADIVVGGRRVQLNSQDHAVAYGRADVEILKGGDGQDIGVQVDYTLCQNAAVAKKKRFAQSDVAFLLRVRYYLQDGNFYVEASWENASGNPEAFLESIGLMGRFGALRAPGKEDFLLLPDGCGALLYPGRGAKAGAPKPDLRFAVYGEDPASPLPQNSDTLHYRDAQGRALTAGAPVFGVRKGQTAFVAVIEEGAALASIEVRQDIPGEVAQCAVGTRFAVTPALWEEDGTVRRAAESYGADGQTALRLCYRFFNGESANFNTMAVACREQLIAAGLLSSTKSVQGSGYIPMNLTLLGSSAGARSLTNFAQALDILSRLKNKGVDHVNLRYTGILGDGRPERAAPLLRLGGRAGLDSLQQYCVSQGFALFVDAPVFPAGGSRALQAADLRGQALRAALPGLQPYAPAPAAALRNAGSIHMGVRAVLSRLRGYETAGIALGDLGSLLYTDFSAQGQDREKTAALLGEQCLPAFSAQWLVMLDTGFLHAVRAADVVVNLPFAPQLPAAAEKTGGDPRYAAVPLLPILLRGSMEYSGEAFNLAGDSQAAFLRSVAFGACPAYTWIADNADPDEPLYFERRLEDTVELEEAVKLYARANTALADLRADRITAYSCDFDTGVSTTRFSSDAVIYVNFGDKEVTVSDIKIPAGDFVRIG